MLLGRGQWLWCGLCKYSAGMVDRQPAEQGGPQITAARPARLATSNKQSRLRGAASAWHASSACVCGRGLIDVFCVYAVAALQQVQPHGVRRSDRLYCEHCKRLFAALLHFAPRVNVLLTFSRLVEHWPRIAAIPRAAPQVTFEHSLQHLPPATELAYQSEALPLAYAAPGDTRALLLRACAGGHGRRRHLQALHGR